MAKIMRNGRWVEVAVGPISAEAKKQREEAAKKASETNRINREALAELKMLDHAIRTDGKFISIREAAARIGLSTNVKCSQEELDEQNAQFRAAAAKGFM